MKSFCNWQLFCVLYSFSRLKKKKKYKVYWGREGRKACSPAARLYRHGSWDLEEIVSGSGSTADNCVGYASRDWTGLVCFHCCGSQAFGWNYSSTHSTALQIWGRKWFPIRSCMAAVQPPRRLCLCSPLTSLLVYLKLHLSLVCGWVCTHLCCGSPVAIRGQLNQFFEEINQFLFSFWSCHLCVL